MKTVNDKKIIVEINSPVVKQLFEISCDADDNSIIKEYLENGTIDPCANDYGIFRYAIRKKARNVVDEILNSNSFKDVSVDTKYSLKIASITGDDEFALYMLN